MSKTESESPKDLDYGRKMASLPERQGKRRQNLNQLNRRQVLKAAIATSTVGACDTLLASDARHSKLAGKKKSLPVLERVGTGDAPLKKRAKADYQNSLQNHGGRLSNPIRQLFTTAKNPDQVHFGVVVIGSGYGASICAARISARLRNQHRMCVLERGKEWMPGTFPDSAPKVFGNTRNMIAGPQKGQLNNPLGLFNVMMNDEVNILTGNGLGGGSLINASIALRPHHEVFSQERWPAALRDVRVLAPYYDTVARQLSLSVTPFDQTPKVRSRRIAAERINTTAGFYDRSNISVMYDHRHLDSMMRNKQGMIQRPCTLCGDCITGCNVGAKNTLLMNYLPIAKHNGAEFYTQCEVNSIEPRDGFYRLKLTYIHESSGGLTRHPVTINSRMVVVGAGSPGSATILMQSAEKLSMSSALGSNWSGNGDTIGFVTGAKGTNNIGGYGAHGVKSPRPGVGPTVQTSLNFYSDHQLFKRLLVQDAAIPRAMSNLFTLLLGDRSLDRSMAMLGMGHDGAKGRVVWKDGRWQVSWPGLKENPYRKMVFKEFEKIAKAHGGRYKQLKAFGDNMVTVHPLGGCAMSDDPAYGVVNHLGQVFKGTCDSDNFGNASVHTGLYVADGSVVPTALGVNPYMTIGALAERIAHHIVFNPVHADLFDAQLAG